MKNGNRCNLCDFVAKNKEDLKQHKLLHNIEVITESKELLTFLLTLELSHKEPRENVAESDSYIMCLLELYPDADYESQLFPHDEMYNHKKYFYVSIKKPQNYFPNPLIDKAESLRETDRTDEAIEILQKIIEQARAFKAYSLLGSALGHLALCYKHKADRSVDKNYWGNAILSLCAYGLKLPLPDSQRAVFKLRIGDVAVMIKDTGAILENYEMALEMVKKDGHEEAEYLGHLAMGELVIGHLEDAYLSILTSFKIMAKCKDVRPWHRNIIMSGLWGRRAKIERANRFYFVSIKSATIATMLTVWGLVWYGNKKRWQQLIRKITN